MFVSACRLKDNEVNLETAKQQLVQQLSSLEVERRELEASVQIELSGAWAEQRSLTQETREYIH